MRKLLFVPVIAVGLGLGAWALLDRDRDGTSQYRFVEVSRGDVTNVVSSTGTLQATKTVSVGTQVSGKISDIFVDFNDHVTENQLIALIDPTILQQEVRSAEANLDRSQAELDQAKRELDRMQRLYEAKVVTESEYSTAQYQYAVAQAALKSGQVNLERAQRNLTYTEIRAPISGVVLARAVDVGQTVAASFSAPLLFQIAEDLSELEILASVDESDIGRIHEGQDVSFTVQAYPDEKFAGTVKQVRLQSTTQENVVSYAVVIAVKNADGRLLPSMTATVEFIVESAPNALRVPNGALRFRPTNEMLAEARKQFGGEGRDASAAGRHGGARQSETGTNGARGEGGAGQWANAGRAGGHSEAGADSADQQDHALLWFIDDTGRLGAKPVTTGITDGQYTVIGGEGITEGMKAIASVVGSAATSTTASPFSNERDRPHGPPM